MFKTCVYDDRDCRQRYGEESILFHRARKLNELWVWSIEGTRLLYSSLNVLSERWEIFATFRYIYLDLAHKKNLRNIYFKQLGIILSILILKKKEKETRDALEEYNKICSMYCTIACPEIRNVICSLARYLGSAKWYFVQNLIPFDVIIKPWH